MSYPRAHPRRHRHELRGRMRPPRRGRASSRPPIAIRVPCNEEVVQLPYVLLVSEAWRWGLWPGRGRTPPRQAPRARSMGVRHASKPLMRAILTLVVHPVNRKSASRCLYATGFQTGSRYRPDEDRRPRTAHGYRGHAGLQVPAAITAGAVGYHTVVLWDMAMKRAIAAETHR